MNRVLSVVASVVITSVALSATGTDYGTNITNTAILSYKVSGVDQNTETSNEDIFIVDRKVDVTVATTDTQNVIVVPKINEGTENDTRPLTFTVTNNSNGRQDYILSASNLADGTATLSSETDNKDYSSDLKICIDNTCSEGDISGTNIIFNEGDSKTYYIFADIPDSAEDGERGSIALTAAAVEDDSTTLMTDNSSDVDNKTSIDIVFAEGAGVSEGDALHDGKHSALSAYEVATATITVLKGSCVVSDGITEDDSNAKRIPGATVRYTIDVQNGGSADTEEATLTDTLQSDLTYVSGKILDEACNCLAPSGNEVDSVSNSGSDITVNYGTISAGTHECAYIEAIIN